MNSGRPRYRNHEHATHCPDNCHTALLAALKGGRTAMEG
jgi:hypothetical protein